jgi:hypothetical protein
MEARSGNEPKVPSISDGKATGAGVSAADAEAEVEDGAAGTPDLAPVAGRPLGALLQPSANPSTTGAIHTAPLEIDLAVRRAIRCANRCMFEILACKHSESTAIRSRTSPIESKNYRRRLLGLVRAAGLRPAARDFWTRDFFASVAFFGDEACRALGFFASDSFFLAATLRASSFRRAIAARFASMIFFFSSSRFAAAAFFASASFRCIACFFASASFRA